jgi:hypothetical protein
MQFQLGIITQELEHITLKFTVPGWFCPNGDSHDIATEFEALIEKAVVNIKPIDIDISLVIEKI